MRRALAVILFLVALACGLAFHAPPYRLRWVAQPEDMLALAHSESPYSDITWTVSASSDFQQLRFFDRVEGGACLHPSWDDLRLLAAHEPTLRSLVPAAIADQAPLPGGPMWTQPWLPNPGPLSNSPYIRLFPIGVLLNQRLIAAAHDDPRAAAPRVLVVGLGSGIGIATLAYYFPQAAITVVDIDQKVVDMVRDHFPLVRWLGTQRLADGTPRLRFVVRDARQFIRYDGAREATAGHPYDLVILDAYTSGSTIPPHLMTREFYAQIAAILAERGIVLANVIGSYLKDPASPSTKYLVVGGAIRTFRAAGLTHVWNFPVMSQGEEHFDPTTPRNNLIAASASPIDPQEDAAGWARLRAFQPYPELTAGTYISTEYSLVTDGRITSSTIAADRIDPPAAPLHAQMAERASGGGSITEWTSQDRALIDRAASLVLSAAAKAGDDRIPLGWDAGASATMLYCKQTDWVQWARETFHLAIATASDRTMHSGEYLVGDLPEGPERAAVTQPTWLIPDAPLFTDQMPNADIYNN